MYRTVQNMYNLYTILYTLAHSGRHPGNEIQTYSQDLYKHTPFFTKNLGGSQKDPIYPMGIYIIHIYTQYSHTFHHLHLQTNQIITATTRTQQHIAFNHHQSTQS